MSLTCIFKYSSYVAAGCPVERQTKNSVSAWTSAGSCGMPHRTPCRSTMLADGVPLMHADLRKPKCLDPHPADA